jgi:hypothetical protein
MTTDFSPVSSVVGLGGILEYVAISSTLPQSVVVTSCKVKFFHVICMRSPEFGLKFHPLTEE